MTAHSKDEGRVLTGEALTRTLEWARRFVDDCAAPGSTPPLHVSGDAMFDVCRALLSSSAAERGMREALAEWDRLSLVIEIAVRNEEPVFYDQVLRVIKSTRAALTRGDDAATAPTDRL